MVGNWKLEAFACRPDSCGSVADVAQACRAMRSGLLVQGGECCG